MTIDGTAAPISASGTALEPPPPPSEAALPRAGKRRRPGRVWLFRLLVLLPIVLGQELLFRWEFPSPEVRGFNRIAYQMMAQTHRDLSRATRQGLVCDRLLIESKADGFSEIHTLNIYGFRGRDFRIAPTPRRRRILLVGDSVTEGMGASDSQTIAQRLERGLNDAGQAAEVINLGVIAATLDHVTIMARDSAALLRPTDMVVILYANDLPASPYNEEFNKPAVEFPRVEESWWTPRLVSLYQMFIHDRPFHRRWPHQPIRFFAAVPDGTNPWTIVKSCPPELDPKLHEQMLQGTLNPWLMDQSTSMLRYLTNDFSQGGSPERHLRRIAEVCREARARLVIAYVPFCGVVHARYVPGLVKLGMDPLVASQLATDARYRNHNRHLAEVCARLGLPLVDTTEDLIQADRNGERQYWEYDTHPRPAGYVTIAIAIERALRSPAQ